MLYFRKKLKQCVRKLTVICLCKKVERKTKNEPVCFVVLPSIVADSDLNDPAVIPLPRILIGNVPLHLPRVERVSAIVLQIFDYRTDL